MRKHEALARLRASADAIRALGARSLYRFGSTARDGARPDSDVDLFVGDYDEDFTAIELVRLRDRVGALLGAHGEAPVWRPA